jgi:hypothetical protein
MQLDKNAIDKLLTLDDRGLWGVIKMIAAQSGLSLPNEIGSSELASLRSALGSASDADIAAASELLRAMKDKKDN